MTTTKQIADRIELLDLIGTGRTGEVYRARLMYSGEIVAVKRLRAETVEQDPTAIKRFQLEAEALQLMDHPNIVTVQAAFEHEKDYYIVMEFTGKGSLQSRLAFGAELSVQQALDVALDISDALTRAHRVQIIHRDIKPANILFADDGSVRLTDFGVAYISNRPRITQTGQILGTVQYMSPEMLKAKSDIDIRTDIWSFGVVLYQMLTKQLPFQGEHFQAWRESVMTDSPKDIQTLRPEVSDTLATLVKRMLEKDRNKRIPSTRQIGAVLESVLDTL
jgi:eukaryotic-like serine/threonine-protein kinase